MILSDVDIRKAIAEGRISIDPFDESDVQPSSIDLHVDRFFRTFHNARYPFIDVKKQMDELTELVEVGEEEPFILHPGEFVLGSTREYVKLPDDLVARLEGKSSLGRLGLLIHSSLPADEPIAFLYDGILEWIPIEEIVCKELEGSVIAFDPITLEVGFHSVTGYWDGPPDKIFEVELISGRRVRVTGGHSLFSPSEGGGVRRVRVHELVNGSAVAVPNEIPYGRVVWDEVRGVSDTGVVEPVFDLEVRPSGRRVENFLAGTGGVFASNTAGFVDAGFQGHLTLELSNVANLPITIYPNMKIGQISFYRMTSEAERPYGSKEVGSKYQGQRGPTPSRYYENFK